MKTLRILGTRGVPAAHGGFETFAEQLALYLVGRGWRVVVYCQEEGGGAVAEDTWQGVERVRIPVARSGSAATIDFDWLATRHAARHARGRNDVWHRAKWGALARTWFWLNDWAGCWLGNHLVADHPEIALHLQRAVPASKVTTIPYGADALGPLADTAVRALGLQPGRYLTLIARPEPENSVLEVVEGFSRHPRGMQLVVLGSFSDSSAYHRAVRAAASAEVVFVGAIYDKPMVQALRQHCVAYVHGHQVGGTNPSLVEALGAGNAVLAHDNRYNRWVASDAARYFTGADSFSDLADSLLPDATALATLRGHALRRSLQAFTWPLVLADYETLLSRWLPARQ
jgi:glycosyltransferase involved in cell wall biosynthesis